MLKPEDFQRVPLNELTNPKKTGPLMCYKDHWWAVDENGCVMFYKGKSYSPQCNVNKSIVDRHLAPGVAVKSVFVWWAWVPFSISDYA